MANKEIKKVYLAGPDVFFPNVNEISKNLKKICTDFNLEGLFPLDNEITPLKNDPETALKIFKANKQMIENADAVIANLSPFRGPSADPGTVWEVGYALGLGKPVFGYSDKKLNYKDKCANDGLMMEDFQLDDNLMIICSINTYNYSFIEAVQNCFNHFYNT